MANDTKLNAVVSLTDRMSKPLKGINKQLKGFSSPLKSLSAQFKQMDRLSGFKNLRSGLAGVGRQVRNLGIVSAGVAVAGFASLNRLAQSGDAIVKMSSQYDMSTKQIQEYIFMAERSGVSTEAITDSMKEFTKRLSEARQGEGELYNQLMKVNPEFLEQILAINDNGEAYDYLLTQMSKLPTQQQQILLGDKAMGASGEELVKIVSAGADAMEALRMEAHKYGAVLSDEVLQQSAQFQDQMTNTRSILKTLTFSIGGGLMPVITELTQKLTAWYSGNKKIIDQRMQDVGRRMADGLRKFVAWAGETIPKVASVVQNLGGLKTVAIGVAAVIAGPLVSALATLSVALLTTPVGWFITAIGAIIGLGGMMIGAWNPIEKFFPNLWNGIVDTVGRAIYTIVELMKKTSPLGIIVENWEPITQFFSDMWGGIQKIFDDGMAKIQPIIDKLSAAAETITKPVKKLFEFGSKSVDAVGDMAGNAVSGAKGVWNSLTGDRNINSGGKQSTDVGGRVEFVVTQGEPPRLKSMKPNNPNVPFDFYAGNSLVGM